MLFIRELKCEHLDKPIGVCNKVQVFSWTAECDHNNSIQISYELQLASGNDFKDIIYDSRRIVSDDNLLKVKNHCLKTERKYYARVRIENNYGEHSNYKTIEFETGIDKIEFSTASFITGDKDCDCDKSDAKCNNKKFHIVKKIVSAKVYATAKGVFNLYLNSVKKLKKNCCQIGLNTIKGYYIRNSTLRSI